ncbi:MAG: hypothetical protein IPK99_14095 [Flavobacteriales bacterium]|nr:hypothetical protein [Flavobacteriales bacterium]
MYDPNPTWSQIAGLPSGWFPLDTTWITYTAVDADGNPATCIFSVIVSPTLPTLSYGVATFCANTGSANPSSYSPVGGNFSCSDVNLVINSQGTIDLNSSAPGTYTVDYTIAGTCNTMVSANVVILPAANAGSDATLTICSSSAPVDLGTLLSGADAGGTWSSGPVVSAAGSYTYTVSNNCGTDVASFTINVTPILSAGTDNSATICDGSTIDLSTLLSGADAGGVWSSGPVVNAAGSYTYTVSNTCGTDVASFTISVTPILSAGADNSATICAGSTIDLSTLLSGADAGGVWSSGPVVSAAGSYTYTVSNACGTDVASFTISVTPILSAGADNSATICAGSTIDLAPLSAARMPVAFGAAVLW